MSLGPLPPAAAVRDRRQGEPTKALVVDDQATTRALLSRILRVELGCHVVEAAHGAEAIGLLGRHRFDLMVLDIVMPGLDGIDTLERVRRTPALKDLPVVVLSAVSDEARVRRLVGLGITGYLVKPLPPLDVAYRLKRMLPTLGNSAPPRAPSGDRASPIAALRPHLEKAAVQVCGMMLGLDVQADAAGPEMAPGDDIVRLTLSIEGETHDLVLMLWAPRETTTGMPSPYLQGRHAAADDAATCTMRELATVIAGRLQSELRSRGHGVAVGAATVTRAGDDLTDDLDEALSLSFSSRTQDFRFTTVVRGVAADRPQPRRGLHPEPVARTLTMDMSLLPPPVDAEVLDMLDSLQEPGEPDLLVELVSLFLRDTPERLRELVVRPLDGSPVARVAHAVKGSAGNLGATHLQDLASELEQAGHESRGSDELARLADAVCAEFGRVELYLQGIIATRAESGPTTH